MSNEAVAHSSKEEPKPKPIALYSMRLARECLLEHLCPPDHPVLLVERQLIAEAKQALQEYLLSSGLDRKNVERDIRKRATQRLALLTDDADVLKRMTSSIRKKSLDDVFPVIN